MGVVEGGGRAKQVMVAVSMSSLLRDAREGSRVRASPPGEGVVE
jgi:hypothetical protein